MKTPEKVGALVQYRYGDNRVLNRKENMYASYAK